MHQKALLRHYFTEHQTVSMLIINITQMKLLTTLLIASFLFSCSKRDIQEKHTLKLSLTTPVDNGKLKTGTNADFTWNSTATDVSAITYHGIKIVEIIGNQSPEDAMRTNKPFFERDSIERKTITIVPSAGTPGFVLDKKYAWQVVGKQKSLSANSSIAMFTIVR